eukprot:SAG22_NODE_23036_length_174_cov_61.653333_1_plen_41_part_10
MLTPAPPPAPPPLPRLQSSEDAQGRMASPAVVMELGIKSVD